MVTTRHGRTRYTPQLALLRVALLPWARLEPLRAGRTVEALASARALEARLEELAPRLAERLFAAAGPKQATADAAAVQRRMVQRRMAQRRLARVALRRSVHNRRTLDEAVLRDAELHEDGLLHKVGLLHEDGLHELAAELRRYQELLEAIAAQRTVVLEAGVAEIHHARRHVLALSQEPLWSSAIALVSRSLYGRLRRLTHADAAAPSTWTHDERHTVIKLLAYLDRAASKTSPNGLFCATAVATWDQAWQIDGTPTPPRVDLRLNVTEARKLTSWLGYGAGAAPLRRLVRPRVNPTVRRTQRDDGGEVLTFWRPASLRRQDDEEALQRLGAQPIVELFVEMADGRRTVEEVLEAVARAAGQEGMEVSVEQLGPFLDQLVDAGLLLAEIELPYNCGRPLAALAQRVRHGSSPRDAPSFDALPLEEIEAIEADLAAIGSGFDTPQLDYPAQLDAAARRLDALRDAVAERTQSVLTLERDELFRLDAASPLQARLPQSWLSSLQATVDGYARLFASMYPADNYRRRWASAFLDAWPADTDVPVLDLYQHFQPPPPEDRSHTFPLPQAEPGRTAWRQARRLCVELARAAQAAGEHEVILDDEVWRRLTGLTAGAAPPAWTVGVLFQPLASSIKEDVSATGARDRLVLNALFSGTGVAFARFADLHAEVEPELRRQARRIDNPYDEEDDDAPILAELTYNHWGRTANAGLRPRIHAWEIELPGSCASTESRAAGQVLTLADLTLRYDSQSERFELLRARDGRRVLPVLTSGVSPEGLVALLVAVGRQEWQPLGLLPGFAWPEQETEASSGVEAWPRFVRVEGACEIVLWRRRWRFARRHVPESPRARPGDDVDRLLAVHFAALDAWRHRHGLPRHVYLHTDEVRKPIHVDLESPLHAELLRRRLAAEGGDVHVTEALPGPDELRLEGQDERWNVEVLVQLREGSPVPSNR